MSRRQTVTEERDAQQVQTAPAEETTQERETTAAETQQSKTTTAAETPAQERETQQTQTQQKRRVGRPTDCTPELTQRIADLVREVGFIQTVVNLVGIGERTHYLWMEKGEADIEAGEEMTPYALYVQAIKKAKADFHIENLRQIREGKQGWQARAWLNERSDPETFSVRQRIEHSGRIETNAAPVLSPAEYEARRAAILGGRGANAARVQH